MMQKAAYGIVKVSDKLGTINRGIAKAMSKGLIKYSDTVLDESIYWHFRNKTAPYHWLWINSYLSNLKKQLDEWPFAKPGLYVGVSDPGGGKSSLMSEVMWRAYVMTGKGSLVNVNVEKPRYDETSGRRYKLNALYDMKDFFNDKDIKIYPNQYQFATMQVDEAHRLWNRRYNSSNDYNSTFGGFMKYAVGVRHFIGQIFMWTQLEEVDTQINSLAANNFFEVEVKKGFDYDYWLLTGEWNNTILGWHVQFFKLSKTGVRTDTHYHYIKRTFDINYFDSLNLQEELKQAKIDNRHKITREKK